MFNGMNQAGNVIVMFFGILVAVVFREYIHAKVAQKLGDRSEGTKSRATFSPIPHIDVLGTIIFPILFLSMGGLPLGWGKPQAVDTRYFKKIKRDIFFVSFAGSTLNFGMALVCAIILRFLQGTELGGTLTPLDTATNEQINPVPVFLNAIGLASVVIGIYNILPVPQTDGWRALLNYVKYETAKKLNENAMAINIVFLLLFITGVMSPLFRIGIVLFKLVSG
jgi:Zn-dependent protease